jgi:alanine racemase
VVLIGSQEGSVQTADDLADQAGTISYDILTGLMPRVPRLYARGGHVDEVGALLSGREWTSPVNATS